MTPDASSIPTETPAPSRPWWMTVMSAVCVAALVISVPRDLFFADTRGVEVWLGFEITGWAAILSAPLHWAIFAVGAWAFWAVRPWVVPWAAAYLFYVALSHLVWSEASANGRGWPIGLAQAAGLSVFGFLLLRAHRRDAAR
jgi:hypothetical protein